MNFPPTNHVITKAILGRKMDTNFIPKGVCINYNKFEFYGKAFGDIQVKITEVEQFFNKNSKLIRKEKLLQIRKNLS